MMESRALHNVLMVPRNATSCMHPVGQKFFSMSSCAQMLAPTLGCGCAGVLGIGTCAMEAVAAARLSGL